MCRQLSSAHKKGQAPAASLFESRAASCVSSPFPLPPKTCKPSLWCMLTSSLQQERGKQCSSLKWQCPCRGRINAALCFCRGRLSNHIDNCIHGQPGRAVRMRASHTSSRALAGARFGLLLWGGRLARHTLGAGAGRLCGRQRPSNSWGSCRTPFGAEARRLWGQRLDVLETRCTAREGRVSAPPTAG
jgi:hypothetical protein